MGRDLQQGGGVESAHGETASRLLCVGFPRGVHRHYQVEATTNDLRAGALCDVCDGKLALARLQQRWRRRW